MKVVIGLWDIKAGFLNMRCIEVVKRFHRVVWKG